MGNSEKISYSFLEPGASYYGTYNELDGLISPSNAFKTAGRDAFNLIEAYTKIDFEEVTETGDVVGDFRIGIADANHFGMDLLMGHILRVFHMVQPGVIFSLMVQLIKIMTEYVIIMRQINLVKTHFILLLFYTKLSIH